ncbi:MAG: anthranilate synthase component I [Candidatus Pelagibacter sp.]|nr:anthranilate synthase component I [Candidatus Pelagibacter sp.]OUV87287.1 MAG: anthranilate synthase component I [Pelagibacteraceae bacterium TMED136]|tara:strand:- start:51151 stop:52590 length:1440 start_codon:yes stop_codon:yes gene_type:complete
MIDQTKVDYEKIKKTNKISLCYIVEKKVSLKKIELLIDNVLNKTDSFIFESVEKAKTRGRYTIFGFKPDLILEIKNKDIFLNKKKIKKKILPQIFLENFIKEFNYKTPAHLPSMSTLLSGYFGYDIIRYFEKIPDNNLDDLQIPDVKLIRPNFIYIHDNQKNKLYFIKLNFKKTTNYLGELNNLRKQVIIDTKKNTTKINKENIYSGDEKIKSNVSRKKFLELVKKAKKYISIGDIFQVVLSQRFEKKLNSPPLEIYKKIRKSNPSPFLYYFNFDQFQIIGSSPEILVRVRKDIITIRPIAGTRKRGRNKKEDANLANELLNDPKELSEHLMLLDLGRNDVGRSSVDGSVKVNEKFKIEKYSHVMHIVSNVYGKFKKNISLLTGLLSGFPAGTVSGAPKIRAMEIIDELENRKRKLYAGGVGYFSGNGDMDTCIALRTALVKNKKIYVQAGAGIVADSVPEKEYQETRNKAQALLEATK